MVKNQEELLDIVYKVLQGESIENIEVDEEADEFTCAVAQLVNNVSERGQYLTELANGNLKYTLRRNHNMLLGPVKDLQASLRHLLWNVEQAAKGQYNYKIEFLGEFSDVFNIFLEQIHLREESQKQKIEAEKEIFRQKNNMLSRQLEIQIAHYETTEQMIKRIRSIKHDLKNHYFTFNELLNKGDLEGAKEYLASLVPELVAKDNDYILNTGNYVFDALVTEKVSNAKTKGIKVSCEISIKPQLNIANMDWCILIGNALDNAIEACKSIDEEKTKEIVIKAKSKNDILSISIINTANTPNMDKYGNFLTTKQDKENHGVGLKNIEEVVTKYDGVLKTTYEDGYFTLTALLCGV